MHHVLPLRVAAATLLAAALAAGAAAQDPWPFLALEVHRYDSLVDTQAEFGLPCCVPAVIAAPGQTLVHVSALVDVPWSESLDSVSLGARDLTLTVPGGEPLSAFGSFAYRAAFEAVPRYVSARRPRDWPEEDADLVVEAVWAVPEGATAATLTFGEFFATEIAIPGAAEVPLAPSALAAFAIEALHRVDAVPVSVYAAGPGVAGSMSATSGALLRLDVAITALAGNRTDGQSGFVVAPRYLQLVDPDGRVAVNLGRARPDSVTASTVTYSADAFPAGPFAESYYFLASGTPGTYTLHFLTDPVGGIALE
ncbi:MAG: hypothetical protein R3F55_06660 [Alphaproteobacteria bacterium]